MTDPRTRVNPGSRSHELPQPGQNLLVRQPHVAAGARTRRAKPESGGVRMVLGLAGLASASALGTAMLPSILPQPVILATGVGASASGAAQQPDPSVIHVTRVVQLAPGQTLPPDLAANGSAPVAQPQPQPTARPTPRVIYQTITRQSGKP